MYFQSLSHINLLLQQMAPCANASSCSFLFLSTLLVALYEHYIKSEFTGLYFYFVLQHSPQSWNNQGCIHKCRKSSHYHTEVWEILRDLTAKCLFLLNSKAMSIGFIGKQMVNNSMTWKQVLLSSFRLLCLCLQDTWLFYRHHQVFPLENKNNIYSLTSRDCNRNTAGGQIWSCNW